MNAIEWWVMVVTALFAIKAIEKVRRIVTETYPRRTGHTEGIDVVWMIVVIAWAVYALLWSR